MRISDFGLRNDRLPSPTALSFRDPHFAIRISIHAIQLPPSTP
jgi:hypothetical protein